MAQQNLNSSPVAALGIDVGGTKIAAGVVLCSTGKVLYEKRIATDPERDPEAILRDVSELAFTLNRAAQESGYSLHAVGLGVPEIVSLEGTIESGYTIDWRNLQIREFFSGIGPTTIVSDVRAAALAESTFGEGCDVHSFGYITIGSGISSCLVIDGEPYPGSNGAAHVLASAHIECTCPYCGRMHHFNLEQYASGAGIARRYSHATSTREDSAEVVLNRATEGDAQAEDIVYSAGRALGTAIGLFVNVTDPQVVVIGGGLGNAGGAFRSYIVEAAYRHIWHAPAREVAIVNAALEERAGVVGAALYATRGINDSSNERSSFEKSDSEDQRRLQG